MKSDTSARGACGDARDGARDDARGAQGDTRGARGAQGGAPDQHDIIKQKGILPLRCDVKGAVITCSDRCVSGERDDKSGPLLASLLGDYRVIVDEVTVVPDNIEQIRAAITAAIDGGAKVIVTTGGTGVTPYDLTPEATEPFIELRLRNIETQIAAYGLTKTPLASLSRGLVGITERGSKGVLIVNAPGSRGGVKDTMAVVGPLIAHILEQFDPKLYALTRKSRGGWR